MEVGRSEQHIFWDYEEHLGTILAKVDDPLGKLAATVDFERFRPILEKAAGRPRGAKGRHPALDAVLKFKMPVLQSLHDLSMDATEDMVRDFDRAMRRPVAGLRQGPRRERGIMV